MPLISKDTARAQAAISTEQEIIDAFLDAMAAAGVHLDRTGGHPIADGKLHRAPALHKKRKKNDHIYYVLHLDSPASGAFGDMQAGVEDTWTMTRPNAMSSEERTALRDRMERVKAEREAELKALQASAVEASKKIMAASVKATPQHPYLSAKGLPVFPGLRVLDKDVRYTLDEGEDSKPRTARKGNLIVPLFSPAKELVGVQQIFADGTKRFIKGTAKQGAYTSIGPKIEGEGEKTTVIFAEGYATGARLHQATKQPVFVTFDSGNILPVAKAIREKYPHARFLFAADNDRHTKKPIDNPGVTKAREAAEETGGVVAIPEFERGEEDKSDFDDLAQVRGLDAVRDTLRAALRPPEPEPEDAPPPHDEAPDGPEGEIARVINESASLSADDASEMPTIQIKKGSLPEAVDAADEVLSRNIGIYARGSILVRPTVLPAPGLTLSSRRPANREIGRPAGSIVINRIEAEALTEALTRHAHWVKYDGRSKDLVSVDCPNEVSRTYLARKGDGWSAPNLRTIIQCPCLRDDGSVISKEGYDAKTGLLLISRREWNEIPPKPSRIDAADALEILNRPLAGFPFVSEADHAAAYALLITAVVRPILSTAPMFAVTAPTAGTGKSLLVDIASIMATGRPAAVMTPSPDESEMEKRLGSAAIAGDSVMNIDNVSAALRSDFLCSFLTQQEVKVRPLGRTGLVSVPSTALVCATGNNLRLVGDLNRRTVFIRLDAGVPKPDERHFDVDALALAERERANLVAAALTIVKAYFEAGQPNIAVPTIGGFEDWSGLIRSALIWINAGDPSSNADAMRSDDPELTELAEIMAALYGEFGASEFKLKEIKASVVDNQDLRSALLPFIDRGEFSTVKFGNYLGRFKGRQISFRSDEDDNVPSSRRMNGEFSIERTKKDHAHGSKWAVRSLEEWNGVQELAAA